MTAFGGREKSKPDKHVERSACADSFRRCIAVSDELSPFLCVTLKQKTDVAASHRSKSDYSEFIFNGVNDVRGAHLIMELGLCVFSDS